ncbi:MAG: MBL fold metallo-hydrolase [Bacteroidia bacterium]
MNLTITGHSTALFSSWYFIEELGLLFDAGDGMILGINQKIGKVKHAFVSHADRDHLSSLYRINPLNDKVQVYYPKDAGSFLALENFSKKFDPDKPRSEWQPVDNGQRIYLRNDLLIETQRNEHIPAPHGIVKSLSYKVYECKKKLKEEFHSLSQEEIKSKINQEGRDSLMHEILSPLITYSGDTPVDDYSRFDNSNILIHEATFIDSQGEKLLVNARNKHSSLEEVLEMVANIKVEKLILGHFSLRYSQELIDSEIKRLCKHYGIKIPVYRMKIKRIVKDVLGQQPVFTP